MARIIFAPHLDDEVIGCYSVLAEVDKILFFCDDYRAASLPDERYARFTDEAARSISPSDTLYLPSRYDYHPLHRKVRAEGLKVEARKLFYSVEMNVPWLEEEKDPEGKWAQLMRLYPLEADRLLDHKYRLFCSVKPFDEVIWASVKVVVEGFHCWPAAPEEVSFLRNKHRHLFVVRASVQQFQDDRDVEFFILQRQVRAAIDSFAWASSTSCEILGLYLKRGLERDYPGRLVKVSVHEDDENGCELL